MKGGAGASAGARGPATKAGTPGKKPRRPWVRFSKPVRVAILARLADGEALSAICADVGMPSHGTVNQWGKRHASFGRALRLAREAAGWPSPTHPGPRYCPALAAAIFARLCNGETLSRICEDPGMPAHSTVYRWRDKFPEFKAALARARDVVADRRVDEGWEIASAVTPGDAYAVSVRLSYLRWMTGCFAPGRFGHMRAVESVVVAEAPPPPPPPKVQVTLLRHFMVEEREEDRACRVVGFTPNPETGLIERDDEGPWEPLPPAAQGTRWRTMAEHAAIYGGSGRGGGSGGGGGGSGEAGGAASQEERDRWC